MRYEREIDVMESEWSPEGGFFWNIRRGHFIAVDFEVR